MKTSIKAIIFDWGRTLYDSETKKEFPEAERTLALCAKRGYRLAIAALVTKFATATLEGRKQQIERSPLRKFFEIVRVTDGVKDVIFDEIVSELNLPKDKILIVEDHITGGIKYGNLRGHPTVWLQQGKFANELPNDKTKSPTFTIHSLTELADIV